MTGLALILVKAGLTFEEIQAAVQIGEQRGFPKVAPRLFQVDEALTPEYWQQVQQEAEQFCLKRYR